jgi:hypothetical protein
METDDFGLFAPWISQWQDLADFEIVRVIPSADARSKALGT